MENSQEFYISKDIYDHTGKVYIRGGQTISLNSVQIDRVHRLGMWDSLVAVDGGSAADGKIRALERYSSALGQIEKKYSAVYMRGKVNEAEEFITQLMCKEGFLHELPYMNALIEYSRWHYVHSVDVAILSVMLAEIIGYDKETLREIVIGALLHEIGVLFISKDILNKQPEVRSESETALLRKSCELGALSVQSFNIPEKSLKIVREHGELLDGTGGPHHLQGKELIDEVRLVSVADRISMETSRGAETTLEQISRKLYLSPQKYDRKFTSVCEQMLQESKAAQGF